MRKYNLNNGDSNCNSNCNCNNGGGRALPFFDVPCLYYPQVSCQWGSQGRCDGCYGIYGLSAPDGGDSFLEFSTSVQEGRCIQLHNDGEAISLLPGQLYLLNYQVRAIAANGLSVVPIIDGISDLCSAAYGNSSGNLISIGGTVLLPVVESPSIVQLQITGEEVQQIGGCLSVVALSSL